MYKHRSWQAGLSPFYARRACENEIDDCHFQGRRQGALIQNKYVFVTHAPNNIKPFNAFASHQI